MSEPLASAAFALHGPEWWVMALLLLLFAATLGLFVLFIYHSRARSTEARARNRL